MATGNGQDGKIFNDFFRWITLMITIIGLNSGAIVYISSIRERVSVIEARQLVSEKEAVRLQAQTDALQKLVMDGMTLRVVLQADAVTMKKQLDRIEELIYNHISQDRLVPDKKVKVE